MFAVMRMQFNQIFAHKPQLIEAIHRALGDVKINRGFYAYLYIVCVAITAAFSNFQADNFA